MVCGRLKGIAVCGRETDEVVRVRENATAVFAKVRVETVTSQIFDDIWKQCADDSARRRWVLTNQLCESVVESEARHTGHSFLCKMAFSIKLVGKLRKLA